MRQLPKVLLLGVLLGVLLSALPGCQSTKTPTTSTVACSVFEIIPYHGKTDAPDTITRIQEHNAAYRELCGE